MCLPSGTRRYSITLAKQTQASVTLGRGIRVQAATLEAIHLLGHFPDDLIGYSCKDREHAQRRADDVKLPRVALVWGETQGLHQPENCEATHGPYPL